jgi:hypothetical protein
MIIKATTTNPVTRFCTMAATPGELMNKATGGNRGDHRRGSAPSRADHGAEMISERSRSQREHNCRPDGSANLLPRCANSMRDQKPRLRKFACLAAITAMLALSGRAAERDLDDLLLVRLPAPPEGRRAPLQVMDGNCPRLSGVCPWWNAMVARQ